jgi:hypothetical protein
MYMLGNMFLVAYIVGTFSLVVVRDDEEEAPKRAAKQQLREFLADHKLDKDPKYKNIRHQLTHHVDANGDTQVCLTDV